MTSVSGRGLALIGLFSGAVALAWLLAPAEADEEGWLRDYGDALTMAEKTGQPILLTFR